jgi:hypothetical protein
MICKWVKTFFIFIFLTFVVNRISAQEIVQLTDVYTGECISARVFVVIPTPSPDKESGETFRNQTVDFFTDRCGLDEGIYYIGLNGKEYVLHRTDNNEGKPPYLTGTFSDGHFNVEIVAARLLKMEYEEGSEKTQYDVENAEYEVYVTIKKDNYIVKIVKAILWYGK